MIKSEAVHCTALTKGEKFLHNKISYEIYSEAGTYHKQHGIENQDAIKVGMKDDYFFCAISDGCGSSKYAKQAADCTIEYIESFFNKHCSDFFKNDKKNICKKMIFGIQDSLRKKAMQLGINLSEMKCTLVMMIIDTKYQNATIIHIGDGIVAKISNGNNRILSYPENGATKNYTYVVNSPNVLNHLRIKSLKIASSDTFIVASDGLYENAYKSSALFGLLNRLDNIIDKKDDCTYCKVSCNSELKVV